MFNSVRLKLTLSNTFVYALIVVVVFASVYIYMSNSLNSHSEQTMKAIFTNNRLRPTSFLQEQKKIGFNYFLVRLNSSGKIYDKSQTPLVSDKDLSSLVEKTIDMKVESGIIKYNDQKFRFLKTNSRVKKDLLRIVYFDTQFEDEVMGQLLIILIIIGTISLFLIFLISLFMADRALIPVKNAMEQQKAFVADASHELRTPLSVIQTNLELVMGNEDETIKSQETWLDNIKSETKRMGELVQNLLFLARADSCDAKIEMKEFSVDELVNTSLISFIPLIEAKNIKLKHEISTGLILYGNESRIRQLLTILMDNAIKYNNKDGFIFLKLKKVDSNIIISITDNGMGIAPEHINNIFKRFYRIDVSRSKKYGGTGLGLSIADCIAKEHNGSIRVKSTPGEGSTFEVLLPAIRK